MKSNTSFALKLERLSFAGSPRSLRMDEQRAAESARSSEINKRYFYGHIAASQH
jgi:hypothetical protein